MAKTKEELEQLKQEYKNIHTKLNELSDDELKTVAGGSGGAETLKISTFFLSGHITADNARVGQYVYAAIDGEENWYSGTIYEIEEESYWIFFTRKKYHIRLTGYNGYGASGTMSFYSTDVTLYTDMEWRW